MYSRGRVAKPAARGGIKRPAPVGPRDRIEQQADISQVGAWERGPYAVGDGQQAYTSRPSTPLFDQQPAFGVQLQERAGDALPGRPIKRARAQDTIILQDRDDDYGDGHEEDMARDGKGLDLSYEATLPPDIQYQLMRSLIERDPQSALTLAAASRNQRSLLGSGTQSVFGRMPSPFMEIPGIPGDAGDLLRARLRLARGAPESDAAPVAAYICLLEGMARFLLDDEESIVLRGRHSTGPFSNRNGIVMFNGVVAHPRMPMAGSLARAHAWYDWLTMTNGQQENVISTIFQSRGYSSTGGQYNPHHARSLAESTRQFGIPIGRARIGSDRSAEPAPLMTFVGPDGFARLARVLGNVVSADDIRRWTERPFGRDDIEAMRPLEEPAAAQALMRFLNEGAQSKMPRRCSGLTPNDRVAIVPFSSVFDIQAYLVPDGGRRVTLMATIRPPFWGLF